MVDEARRAPLLAVLEGHETMGVREAEHLMRMKAFAQTAAHPFDPTSPDGHFTASALVVSRDLDQVLLLHHRRLDRWLQCGGHFEPDDPAPADAALREAREETGLDEVRLHPVWPDLLDVDIHTIPATRGMDAHDHLDLRYLAVADPAMTVARSKTETKALEWCSWEEAHRRVDDAGLRRVFDKVERIRDTVKRS